MKVLHYTANMNIGGIENLLINVLVNTNDYELAFTTFEETINDYESLILEHKSELIRLKSHYEIGYIRYFCQVFRLFKKNRYDVVHSHQLFHSGLIMLIAWLAGVKVRISHAHSSSSSKEKSKKKLIYLAYKWVMRTLMNIFSNRLLGCTSSTVNYVFGNSKFFRRKKVIVPNSIDSSKFINASIKRQELRKNLINSNQNISRYNILVCHIGAFKNVKNQEYILKIAEYSKKNTNDIAYIFVGAGDEFQRMTKLSNELFLDNVFFLGKMQEVEKILGAADVFILPSKFEGLPLTLIEAQSTGIYSIASAKISKDIDIGLNLVEFLEIDDSDIINWYNMIRIQSSKKRLEIGALENAISMKKFDIKDTCETFKKIYMNGSD